MEDDATGFAQAGEGLEPVWRELAVGDKPALKLWMDAYLAAFAFTSGMRLVTLDEDFRDFEIHGLNLWLLAS